MQILGDLIELDDTRREWLPLPWWHRAPLGLTTDTVVYVSISGRNDSGKLNRPGDVIVSVLDPNKLKMTFLLECSRNDRPGAFSEVLSTLGMHNIALAESVTLRDYAAAEAGGHQHRVTLVCENLNKSVSTDKALDNAKKALEKKKWKVTQAERFTEIELQWHDVGTVENGWIKNVRWHEQFVQKYEVLGGDFDFTRMVVSADTDRRYLRCVFPRKNARVITVHHADIPRAMHGLTERLRELDVNILSAILRRGGAKPHNAVLVAVCEPNNITQKIEKENVAAALKELTQEFRISKIDVSTGVAAKDSLYAKHPESFVVHAPVEIASSVRSYRDVLRKKFPNKQFVFLSRRFLPGVPELYADCIKEVLRHYGIEALEGVREPGVQKASFGLIADKLWNCHAGIVLFAAPRRLVDGGSTVEHDGVVANSSSVGDYSKNPPVKLKKRSKNHPAIDYDKSVMPNLAHELGFLHGQGKPVLIMLEKGVRSQLERFSNILGLDAPSFSMIDGCSPLDQRKTFATLAEIVEYVSEWVELWREKDVFEKNMELAEINRNLPKKADRMHVDDGASDSNSDVHGSPLSRQPSGCAADDAQNDCKADLDKKKVDLDRLVSAAETRWRKKGLLDTKQVDQELNEVNTGTRSRKSTKSLSPGSESRDNTMDTTSFEDRMR